MKKKVVIIACCLILGGTSVATAEQGYYFGFMMGINSLSDSDVAAPGVSGEIEYDEGFSGGAFWGYDLGTLRAEAEIRYRAADIDKFKNGGVTLSGSGDFNALSYMVNGYYDFENQSPWTPYLGVGIGAATVEYDDLSVAGFPVPGSEDDTQFAYQFILGAGYSLNQRWMFNVNYRYFGTTDLEYSGGTEIEYSAHNILIGFRRNF